MRFAIAADIASFDAVVSTRFGRCRWFVILDTTDGSLTWLPNPAFADVSNAGLSAVQLMVLHKINSIVSLEFGEKIKPLLDQHGIRMIIMRKPEQISFVLEKINQNHTVMPRMDGTGPEGEGRGTGRKLGRCSHLSDEEKLKQLGKGLGKRRKAGGGDGSGKRKKEGKQD